MGSLLYNHRHFLFFIIVFIGAELIVNPTGNFPLNDDWAYAFAVKTFHETGGINFGEWPAMTLFTHILWGSVFSKLFGFSFFALRLSTMVASVIGAFFLNKLVIKITGNKLLAMTCCLIVQFNPIYFNLTNTYMTDVNFNVLLVICCYLAHDFFQTKRIMSFVLLFVFSILIVLLRQFGIIIPLCFVAACFFIREKKWPWVILACLGTVAVVTVFEFYENYLKTVLPATASYKFSAQLNFFSGQFWDEFFFKTKTRSNGLLLQVLIYTSPLAVLYIKSFKEELKIKTLLITIVTSTLLVWLLFDKESFLLRNIFTNMVLGPETFYESYSGSNHFSSALFATILELLKYVLAVIGLSSVCFILLKIKKEKKFHFANPLLVFFTCIILLYTLIILVSESYFDRYILSMIIIAIILFAWANKFYSAQPKFVIIPLLFMFYVSVAGTKDYFTLNRWRWEAYDYLRNTLKVQPASINGGFEINCWKDGVNSSWRDYTNLQEYDYLIQFKREAGFRLVKEYKFQRYFPIKKDKINIFVREDKN